MLVFSKDWERFPRSLSPAGGSGWNGGCGGSKGAGPENGMRVEWRIKGLAKGPVTFRDVPIKWEKKRREGRMSSLNLGTFSLSEKVS